MSVPEDLAQVKSDRGFDQSGQDLNRERSQDRKIIFSADLSLTVVHPDSANRQIEKVAKKFDGYINEIGSSKTIIRVKSDSLAAALDELSKIGKVTNKSLTGKDVTEAYLDLEIRLENAEKARDRYLELLQKAETVEEILQVEKELERLNEKIDLLKGQMNRINHLDEFSTITVYLKEKKKPGALGYLGLGLYHAVKWLFVRN